MMAPRGRRPVLLALLLTGVLAMALGVAAPAFAAGSWWRLNAESAPSRLVPGGEGQLNVSATNLGYEDVKASTTAIVLSTTVPSGLEVRAGGVRGYLGSGGRRQTALKKEECTVAGQVVTCTVKATVPAYEGFEIIIPVKVASEPPAGAEVLVDVSGGESGTSPESLSQKLNTAAGQTQFGVENYELRAENQEGQLETQAGSHPFQLTTTLNLNQTLEAKEAVEEETVPALVRDLHFVLPPGLLGNVTAVAQCTSLQFATVETGDINQCPAETAIGVARIKINEPAIFHGALSETVPIFSLVPAAGEPARFGIELRQSPRDPQHGCQDWQRLRR